MQSVINFTVRVSVRRYGVKRIYRDLSKLNCIHVKDKNMRYNIDITLKTAIKNNEDVMVLIKNRNIEYLLRMSNLETHPHLSKIYLYIKSQTHF